MNVMSEDKEMIVKQKIQNYFYSLNSLLYSDTCRVIRLHSRLELKSRINMVKESDPLMLTYEREQ